VRQGSTDKTVDADVKVDDSDPQQVFRDLTRSATRETGRLRLGAGYQHNNLFSTRTIRSRRPIDVRRTHLGTTVKSLRLYYRGAVYALKTALSAYYPRS